eukprot:3203090-Amphidinium_carterae.1
MEETTITSGKYWSGCESGVHVILSCVDGNAFVGRVRLRTVGLWYNGDSADKCRHLAVPPSRIFLLARILNAPRQTI